MPVTEPQVTDAALGRDARPGRAFRTEVADGIRAVPAGAKKRG